MTWRFDCTKKPGPSPDPLLATNRHAKTSCPKTVSTINIVLNGFWVSFKLLPSFSGHDFYLQGKAAELAGDSSTAIQFYKKAEKLGHDLCDDVGVGESNDLRQWNPEHSEVYLYRLFFHIYSNRQSDDWKLQLLLIPLSSGICIWKQSFVFFISHGCVIV